jgi:hypothetical protein
LVLLGRVAPADLESAQDGVVRNLRGVDGSAGCGGLSKQGPAGDDGTACRGPCILARCRQFGGRLFGVVKRLRDARLRDIAGAASRRGSRARACATNCVSVIVCASA